MRPTWVKELDDPGASRDPGELRRLFLDHPLLILRGQRLSREQFLELVRGVGEPVPQKFRRSLVVEMGERDATHLSSVSELGWHADESYLESPPEALALYAVRIPPEKGRTYWANTQSALAALPSDLQASLKGKTCFHEFQHFDGYLRELVEFESENVKRASYAYGKGVHPVVASWRGREYLCLNHGFTSRIENAPDELLPQLLDRITAPEHVYAHEWKEGDLVLSNNRLLIHRRDRLTDAARLLYRALFNLEAGPLACG